MRKAFSGLPRNFWITAGLSLLGVLLAALFPSGHRRLAAGAMFLSSLGDLALMNFRGIFQRIRLNGFVTGGVLFLLSHLVYAASAVSLLRENGFGLSDSLSDGLFGLCAAVLLWLFSFISLTVLSVRRKRFGWIKTLLFACYLTAIIVNCAFHFIAADALIRQSPENVWRLAGAVGIFLFWISDYFIGLDKVAGIPDYGRYIWSFYAPGQLLLLLAS